VTPWADGRVCHPGGKLAVASATAERLTSLTTPQLDDLCAATEAVGTALSRSAKDQIDQESLASLAEQHHREDPHTQGTPK
jgi:hypothetical protein